MSEVAMPYRIAFAPVQSVFTSWKEPCPNCNVEKQVTQIVQMINAYGCYDGTNMLILECGHTLMPWQRKPKKGK